VSFLTEARASIRNSFRSTPQNVPTAVTMASRDQGRVGKTNVRMLRDWSEHSEWVRAAINIRKDQVASAEWDIVQNDPDGKPIDKLLAREIRDRIEYANPRDKDWRTFTGKVVEDILVLDAGSIEIEPTFGGEPLYMHPVDGGEVRVDRFWDGTNPDAPRYFWYPDGFPRASWKDSEFIYIMETPRTVGPMGLSKLETLKAAIDSELEGSAFNARQVRNPTPEGLLHLGKGARQSDIDKFRAHWQAEQALGGGLGITGGTEAPAFIKFHDSNSDMQFLEWQVYLVRKIAAVFQLSTQDLNLAYEINRSTAEVNDKQTEDRGVRPLLDLVSSSLTRGYVWSPAFGGSSNNMALKFVNLNLRESLARAQVNKIALGGVSYKTVNQALKEAGMEPQGPEFDVLMMVTPQGVFTIDDVPSAREFMEMMHPKPAAPAAPKPPAIGPGTSKDVE
jgi:hypothetical protein